MTRAVLTTIAGLLIGPVVGFCVTYWLCSVLYRDNCMWRLIAVSMSLFLGAPIGLATFGVVGFLLGRRLDEKAQGQVLREEDSGQSRDRRA